MLAAPQCHLFWESSFFLFVFHCHRCHFDHEKRKHKGKAARALEVHSGAGHWRVALGYNERLDTVGRARSTCEDDEKRTSQISFAPSVLKWWLGESVEAAECHRGFYPSARNGILAGHRHRLCFEPGLHGGTKDNAHMSHMAKS